MLRHATSVAPAVGNLTEGLVLPAVSALHESARLAVTALAAQDGYRFSNTAGAHEAVVDYAFAIKLVDRTQYAQLDQLRDLRHQVNYPEDLIAPSPREIEQYSELVDTILALAEKKLPTRAESRHRPRSEPLADWSRVRVTTMGPRRHR